MNAFFSISGEFFTNHSRQLWAEGKYSKAIDFLDCLDGINQEQKEDILFGRKKLIGTNELDLVFDEWNATNEYDDYPTFKEGLSRGDNWAELKELREDKAWEIAYKEWPYHNQSIFDRTANRYGKILSIIAKHVGNKRAAHIMDLVHNEKIDERFGKTDNGYLAPTKTIIKDDPIQLMMARTQNQLMVAAITSGQDPSAVPTVEAMMNCGSNLEVKIDSDMASVSGWLLPNGNYYGCGSMEHIGLATNLMEHLNISVPDSNHERHAEDLGWIKISKSVTGFHVISKKKVNKKQLNRLWDYSVKHNRDYEELIQYVK
jgi:hypothetical protein